MKKQFNDHNEKQHYLNQLLLDNAGKLADAAIKLITHIPLHSNIVEINAQYYIDLVKYYAEEVSSKFSELDKNGEYTKELYKWELEGIDISYYLNALKVKAAIIIVDLRYYNIRKVIG